MRGLNEPKREKSLKKIFLFSVFLFLLFWSISEKKWVLSLIPAVDPSPSIQKPIAVYSEVLHLQKYFSQVSEVLKPAVVHVLTVHIKRQQQNSIAIAGWNRTCSAKMGDSFPQKMAGL